MLRGRKFNGYCEECKKSICACSAYQYIDGNNEAITSNSPYLCKDCYEKKYHTKIMTDVERYKSNLISALYRFKYEQKIETLKIDNIINYISNT